jgi:20S proteasome alpha/beta subunit
MSVAVGLLCEDGAVVGSDSSGRSSAANIRTTERPPPRTFVVGKDVIVAATGPVGPTQRFKAVVTELREDSRFPETDCQVIAKRIAAAAIEDFASTRRPPGQFGALVGFTCRGGFHLCEFAPGDLQPEMKTPEMWFASLGGGQPVTDAFLAWTGNILFQASPPKVN